MLRVCSRQLEALAAQSRPGYLPIPSSALRSSLVQSILSCAFDRLCCGNFCTASCAVSGGLRRTTMDVSEIPCTQQKLVTLPGAVRSQCGK